MRELRTLWDISEESFRSIVEAHLGRSHVALPGEEVSPEEIASCMPGDELIPVPDRTQMRATTIHAASDGVWPWLAQMMRGAGIYGWPRLESTDCLSSEGIIPEVPPPRIGDRVGELMELVSVDPPRSIVWQSCCQLSVLGLVVRKMSLSYLLTPIDGNRSRLVVRQRCKLDQNADRLIRRISNLVHFLLPASQLRYIKHHAEATATLGPVSVSQLPGTHHQAAPFRPAGRQLAG